MAEAADASSKNKKLRVFFIPFFATSHIIPMTELAWHLAAARPGIVEPTMVVTPANAAIVHSTLTARSPGAVKVLTYPFPNVDGLLPGVENLGSAPPDDAWRIDKMALDLPRPAQEAVLREHRPDAIICDTHFWWNSDMAAELGIPRVVFCPIPVFASLAMSTLYSIRSKILQLDSEQVVAVPDFPGPEIHIPKSELPDFLVQEDNLLGKVASKLRSARSRCFGVVANTFREIEPEYCTAYMQLAKRCYFVGPSALSYGAEPGIVAAELLAQRGGEADVACLEWLNSKPSRSVVYVCFGSYAHVSTAQLRELALGLEASGMPFLWVVRGAGDMWAPEGWEERVGERGMVVRGWAPQVAILSHEAVGAFMTHCGWNSILEAVAAAVPVLTWPMVFEQFINEKLVVEVLGIGEKVWHDGLRSTREAERDMVFAEAIGRAVSRFMDQQQGAGREKARARVKELTAKASTAVAEGGSAYCDLHRLIDDLIQARVTGTYL